MRTCDYASDKPDGKRYCRNRTVVRPQLSRLVTLQECDRCLACNLPDTPETRTVPWKLGDDVAEALSLIGVTEERVTAWIGAPCGCGERKAKLNKLSKWAQRALKSGAERAAEKLEKLLR